MMVHLTIRINVRSKEETDSELRGRLSAYGIQSVLSDRGVIIGVASKSDCDHIGEVLAGHMHGLEDKLSFYVDGPAAEFEIYRFLAPDDNASMVAGTLMQAAFFD